MPVLKDCSQKKAPPSICPKQYVRESSFIRLLKNENLFGPSPRCLEVLKSFRNEMFYEYPNDFSKIREVIAGKFGVKTTHVLVGNGSEELLRYVFHGFLKTGEKILIPRPSWNGYQKLLRKTGAKLHFYDLVKSTSFEYSLELISQQIQHHEPKVVVIGSPNNPTGNLFRTSDLKKILREFPRTFFTLDEAYWGFTDNVSLPTINLIGNNENLLVLRTFSKFYGLAGLRIGMMFAPEKIIKEIEKLGSIFGINAVSQMVAEKALASDLYYDNIKIKIIENREYLRLEINKLNGCYAYPSSANFLLIEFSTRGEAKKVIAGLEAKKVLVKDCSSLPLLEKCIRVTIARRDMMRHLVQCIASLIRGREQNAQTARKINANI